MRTRSGVSWEVRRAARLPQYRAESHARAMLAKLRDTEVGGTRVYVPCQSSSSYEFLLWSFVALLIVFSGVAAIDQVLHVIS